VCDKEIFNIGSPANEVSIRELAIKMRGIYKSQWWDGMSPLSDITEVSGDDFYGQGYDDSDRRIPDIIKAMTLLGWTPKYDLDATIERSMAYWFESIDQGKPNGAAISERRIS
jgi:nucleoside-diphosphate-sugar epimerase